MLVDYAVGVTGQVKALVRWGKGKRLRDAYIKTKHNTRLGPEERRAEDVRATRESRERSPLPRQALRVLPF